MPNYTEAFSVSIGSKRGSRFVVLTRFLDANRIHFAGKHFMLARMADCPPQPLSDPAMFEAHFQTFEEPESGVALTARLAAFREELARRKLAGFVIPRADQQQNEYVPPSEERLAWLTGFTGSAGMAALLTREAAPFVDGPHTLQAGQQGDPQARPIQPPAGPPPGNRPAQH